MLRNGSESRAGRQAKVVKETGKERGKERKAGVATERVDLFATIGVRATGTVAMPQRATSPTMVLKEEIKEKGKNVQLHCQPKP